METYFELIPDELTEIVLQYIIPNLFIIDLIDTKLFNKFLYDINLWKKVFKFYNFPIFNVTVKSIFNNDKEVISKYSNNVLIDMIITEYDNILTTILDYEELMEKKFEITVPVEYLIHSTILYDFTTILNNLSEALNFSTIYFSNKQKLKQYHLFIHTGRMKFTFDDKPFTPSNSNEFIKQIIIYLSYYKYKIRLHVI